VLSTSQGRSQLLFIAPRAKLAVAPLLGKTRGHRTLTGSHRTLNSQRPVLRRQPRVTSRLKSTVAANGYCARAPFTAPPDALLRHTGRVRCTPDSCAKSSADLQDHRTLSTGSVRCSPDPCAERDTKHPHTGCTPPDALRERPVLNPSRVKHTGL